MNARNVLLADFGIAILAAIVVLILTPGVAVAGMIAVVVLIACGVSFRHEARRRKRRGREPPRLGSNRTQARRRSG